MKHMKCRILSIVLIIIIISVSSFSVPVYASHGGGAGVNHDPSAWIMKDTNTINVDDEGKLIYYIEYLMSQIGAIISDHDITKVMANDQTMKSYIAKGYYDANEDTIVFPQETVTYVYNYIQNHYNEWLPFQIQKTYSYKSIKADLFPSKQTYHEFLSYCQSHYMTAFTFLSQVSDINDKMLLGDVSEVVDNGGGFVAEATTSFYTVNSNWSRAPVWYNYYAFKKNEDGDYIVDTIHEHNSQCTIFLNYNPNTVKFRRNVTTGHLVTKDGGRIRVFNSLAEFKDYNAGQRKVYFGSGFYDFDPSDISVKWDEFIDKIDRMDDILQDILDAINDNPNLSEEDLEKLIDKLLDKIGEIGGELGDKTDETNNILSGIASSLSGYYSEVLAALDEILEAIKALVWIEADNKLDDDKSDLLDLIDKIWKDPETGSQEAADTLSGSFAEIASGITKKFPFSIPWDIYSLFTVFSGTAPPDTATYRTVTLGVQPFTVDDEDLEQDEHEAPYFKLPLRIDSFRIYEEVVLDLKDFKPVSKLSRGLLSVLFAVFLIKFTMRIIDLFRGGTDD